MSISEALRNYGISKLAEECGVSPQAAHKWLEAGIPGERVLTVEKLTGISRHDLRPDIFGPPATKARRTAERAA